MTCMWNLKYDTNEPIYETNRLTDTEQTSGCQGGRGMGEGWIGSLRWQVQTIIYRMDKQQGSTL